MRKSFRFTEGKSHSERGDANRMYIEITFTMRDCSQYPGAARQCKETFALYAHEADTDYGGSFSECSFKLLINQLHCSHWHKARLEREGVATYRPHHGRFGPFLECEQSTRVQHRDSFHSSAARRCLLRHTRSGSLHEYFKC